MDSDTIRQSKIKRNHTHPKSSSWSVSGVSTDSFTKKAAKKEKKMKAKQLKKSLSVGSLPDIRSTDTSN